MSENEIIRATCRLKIQIPHDKNNHDVKTCPGCALLRNLFESRRQVAYASNILMRRMWIADATTLEKIPRVNGKLEGKWGFVIGMSEAYRIIREAAPNLASGVCAAISKAIWKKWKNTRWDALVRMSCTPPHFKESCPIPIRRQDYTFLKQDDNTYMIFFSLRPQSDRPDQRGYEYRLPIVVRDKKQQELLAALVNGEYHLGEAKLMQDRLRPSRWYLRMAYKRKIESRNGPVVVGINRGIRHFLVAASSWDVGAGKGKHGRVRNEPWHALCYEGNDIEAFLKQIQSRRRRYQSQVRFSGRTGRGRRRALIAIKKLEARGERWRETKCQTLARQFLRWAEKEGATTIVIEDFSGIRDGLPELLQGNPYWQKAIWMRLQEWPYYKLGMAIKSGAEELGWNIIIAPSQKISMTCPECGNSNAENKSLKKWKMGCGACGAEWDLDEAAATNVMLEGMEIDTSGKVTEDDESNGSNGLPSKKKGKRRTARKTARKSKK